MSAVGYSELRLEEASKRWGSLGEALLFVDGDRDSEEAEELLNKLGVKYRKIDVRNGLRGWLLFDYGTAEVPLLVVGEKVLVGLEEIKKYYAFR